MAERGTATKATQRTHPALWDLIKKKWHEGGKGGLAGKWNARKAQLAVQEYKRESNTKYGDTGYATKKTEASMRNNSLHKWTKEDWGYIDDKKGNRYLPKAVRDVLSPAEKRAENRKKKGKLGSNVPYTDSVRRKKEGVV